jgi:hypothetical protein
MKKNLLLLSILFVCGTSIFAQVPSYVPTNGLVGWWPFNGNANDESGNGNNGTVTGPTLTTDRFGVANRAYYISQATSIIDFGNSQSFGLTNNNVKTFSFWLKSVNGSKIFSIYKYENGNPSNSNYGILGDINLIATTANGTGPNTIANNLTPNVWTHCVCIIQAGTNNSKIYINGNLVSSGTSNLASAISSANLKINSALGTQNYTTGTGYFDDFAIWNRALTNCEIQDLYNAQLNSLSVNAGLDQSVCLGESIVLNASGGTTYSWDNGVQNGVAFTPSITTTYTVTSTSGSGCVATDQVVVNVNSLPTIIAGNDQAVCEGSLVTLTATGGSSYSWTNGVQDGVSFTPSLGSTTYTVTGTDNNSCSNTDQVIVTVNPLPSVNAGQDQVVCEGDDVTLSGTGAVSYSWDNNVIDGTVFTPTHVGDLAYTLTGVDDNGCFNTDEVIVTVNEHSTAAQTETALDSYTWPVNGQTYTQSGTYTAVIPNAAGCDSTITLDLTLSFTGIDEQENSKIIISPNPASDYFVVSAPEELIGQVYSIIDLNGKTLKEGTLTQKEQKIEIGNLSEGMYMFKINNETEQTFRIVKN